MIRDQEPVHIESVHVAGGRIEFFLTGMRTISFRTEVPIWMAGIPTFPNGTFTIDDGAPEDAVKIDGIFSEGQTIGSDSDWNQPYYKNLSQGLRTLVGNQAKRITASEAFSEKHAAMLSRIADQILADLDDWSSRLTATATFRERSILEDMILQDQRLLDSVDTLVASQSLSWRTGYGYIIERDGKAVEIPGDRYSRPAGWLGTHMRYLASEVRCHLQEGERIARVGITDGRLHLASAPSRAVEIEFSLTASHPSP